MTAPVATKVDPGAGPNCENTFTVSFYIPTNTKKILQNPKTKTFLLKNGQKCMFMLNHLVVLLKNKIGYQKLKNRPMQLLTRIRLILIIGLVLGIIVHFN